MVTPAPRVTPVPALLTPTPTITWFITATPLNISSSNPDEIVSIIDQLHPYLCIRNRENLAILTPPPIDVPPPHITFTEVTVLPDPQPRYGNVRVDNIDGTRTAFAIPQPYHVDSLYITDNKTGDLFQVNLGASPFLGFDWMQWFNKDTLFLAQQGHFLTTIMAIDVEKRQFVYFGYYHDCPSTPTP